MEAVNPNINPSLTPTSEGNMSSLITIVVVVLGLFFAYIFYQSYVETRKNTPYLVSSRGKSGREYTMVPGDKILRSSMGIQFSYTFFMKVDDMNYLYGKPKHIMHFGNESGTIYCPGIWIYPEESNLYVRVNSYTKPTKIPVSFRVKEPCDIANIPVQRWVHVGVVLNNRTLDVYIDGVLKRSCELPGIPRLPSDANVYINKDGGFMGRISKMRYYNYALTEGSIMADAKSKPEDWGLWSTITSIGAPVSVSISLKKYE